jgi:hypothetical protein
MHSSSRDAIEQLVSLRDGDYVSTVTKPAASLLAVWLLDREIPPSVRAKENPGNRFASTLVIAASIIAAARLARDDTGRPSPRVQSVIVDSVQLGWSPNRT